jgi:hypothetical protein
VREGNVSTLPVLLSGARRFAAQEIEWWTYCAIDVVKNKPTVFTKYTLFSEFDDTRCFKWRAIA